MEGFALQVLCIAADFDFGAILGGKGRYDVSVVLQRGYYPHSPYLQHSRYLARRLLDWLE